MWIGTLPFKKGIFYLACMMEQLDYLKMLRHVTEEIPGIRNLNEAHAYFARAYIRCCDLQMCGVYEKTEKSNVYVRTCMETEGGKPLKGKKGLPVYLTLRPAFLKKQGTLLTQAQHPSRWVDDDPFQKGLDIFLRPATMHENFIVFAHRTSETALSGQETEMLSILMNFYTQILQSFTLKDEIVSRQQELSGKIVDNNKKLKELNQQLARSNEELTQFAYSASHDLQEPLRTISSYINLFLRNYGENLTEEGADFLKYANDGALRMHTLIKDLLTYSRIDRVEEPMHDFDGNIMLDEALHNLQAAVEESHALVLYPDFPHIYGNQSQIVLLFQNLIDNAIKFHGRQEPLVMIDVNESGDTIEFSVSDNGIGIEPQFREKIFGFFTRLYPTDVFKGTGLGLSICKKIVERHSGSIDVESRPGKGSTFRFTLKKTAGVS